MGIRIQFDISEEDLKRMENYIPDPKHRHVFAHKALKEWITRQEGRDKRFQRAKAEQHAKEMQALIDSGRLRIVDET